MPRLHPRPASASSVGIVGLLIAGLMIPTAGVSVAASPRAMTAGAVSEADSAKTRDDSVSAMLTAQGTGDRVEDLSQRSETTQVFANPDGTWTSEVATDPVRMRDDEGRWHDIDTTLTQGEDGSWGPRWAPTDVRLSDGGGRVFAQLTHTGHEVTFKWDETLPVPVVEGDTATYRGVAPGDGDLVATAIDNGFRYNVVMHEAPDTAVELPVSILTDGADLSGSETGGFEITSGAGKPVATAAAPVMWDSSGLGTSLSRILCK